MASGITFATSQGSEQVYGFSPEEFIADKYLWDTRVPPEDRLQASIRHRLEDIWAERPVKTVHRFLHKDNSLRWIHCTMVPRRNEAQHCWYVTAVGVDITEQKLLEENLRRYERIVSATADGISLVDNSYTYQLINETYLCWNLKHRDQIVGHTVADLLGEEPFTRFVKPNFDRCLQGEVVTYEEWFEFPGVGQKFVSATYSPYRDPKGTISGIVASTRDLTSLKRTEQALFESQLQYLHLVNAVQGIVWEADPVTLQFTFVSAQAEKILGYPVSQWLEENFWIDHIHPEDREAAIANCQTCIQALEPHSFEYRMISADGKEVWLYDTVNITFEESKPGKLQGLMVDITDRKLADASLRDYQQMIQQVADSTLAILYIYDLLENRNVFVNSQIEAVLGYSPAEIQVIGSSLMPSLIHPDDLPQALTLQDRCCQATTDEVLPIEYRMRHKDGSYRWLLSRDRVIKRTANGDPWQILGVATDITHQKQLQDQLAAQLEREHLLASISQRIRQTLDLSEILLTAVHEVRQLLKTERVVLYRLETDGTGTIVAESVEPGTMPLLGMIIEDSCFRNHWYLAYQQGRISQINDIETAAIQACHGELLRRCQVRANLVVPILQGERLWGLLIAHHCSEPKVWQPWTAKLMQRIASQLGIAIQQAEIYSQLQQSERYNRALVDAIPDLLLRVKRDGTRTFIKFGSDYGDQVKLYHQKT
ncbi:MAG: PAS domain-containing protein [Synechococcaceae cyanobacterium SM2_3_1]|nr:PAS domain-containing protein [Synechococcaceae cyanobacterium SM2_3_1]